MGADLLLSAVSIRRGQQPNWAAAQSHVKNVSGADALKIVMEGIHDEEVSAAADYGETEQSALDRLGNAMHNCEQGWRGHMRNIVALDVADRTILIGGGPS